MAQEIFREWAIIELMGHRRLGGYVTEITLAGTGLLRIDVPETTRQKGFSQFYPPTALYCITPTSEDIARAVAEAHTPEPVGRFELRGLDPAHEDPRGRRCMNCGIPVDSASTICVQCAADEGIPDSEPEGNPDPHPDWRCPDCGAELLYGNPRLHHCGVSRKQ